MSTNAGSRPDIQSSRLEDEDYSKNFSDIHPPLSKHEAFVESDRCYFCYDAPCTVACPTSIDIPMFIRQISADNPKGSAKTIFEQNILGGMCARVCPTETLCEEVCVREVAEGKPVEIGRLQRFATDTLMAKGSHPFERADPTGKSIAVVGAGPAGLACAHRLAMHGHTVKLFDARPKAGGLNEFGIAAYKSVDGFAASEVDWLLQIGGIDLELGKRLGTDMSLDELRETYDAVFLSVGLGDVNTLGLAGEDMNNASDAVEFISDLRQSVDLSKLKVGRNVVVIGGGMTAVDAAVQSRLLGAENVTMAYRRGRDQMGASAYEQDLATSKGVRILYNVQPVAVHGNGAVAEVELEYTKTENGKLVGTGETLRIAADQLLSAIGQKLDDMPEGLKLDGGKIAVSADGKTSVDGVWAGGDVASGGDDLTVTAVAEGRDAAEDIHATLIG